MQTLFIDRPLHKLFLPGSPLRILFGHARPVPLSQFHRAYRLKDVRDALLLYVGLVLHFQFNVLLLSGSPANKERIAGDGDNRVGAALRSVRSEPKRTGAGSRLQTAILHREVRAQGNGLFQNPDSLTGLRYRIPSSCSFSSRGGRTPEPSGVPGAVSGCRSRCSRFRASNSWIGQVESIRGVLTGGAGLEKMREVAMPHD
jgi:hypothetical protein